MKLIYENDMPDKIKIKCRPKKTVKSVFRFGRQRWKPNGITDNRKEWRRKNNLYQASQKIVKAVKASMIDSSSIKNLNP